MCMIIDANVVCALFDKKHSKHSHFEPVLNWIVKDKGKIVLGGKKMTKELSKLSSYLKFLRILDTNRKIVWLNNDDVDYWETKLEAQHPQKQFNDAHILAMVIVSHVRIVCTTDAKSLKYVKDRAYYPSGVKKPKIYSRADHAMLLTDQNIAAICKPCVSGSKDLYCEFVKHIGQK